MHVKSSWSFVANNKYSKKMAKISLSDFPIKTLIDELAKTLNVEFSKNYKLHFFKCDVMGKPILLNCRSFKSSFVSTEEDMLFYRPLKITCKAEDIFKFVSKFIATIIYLGKRMWVSRSDNVWKSK